jgi:hypothetical protein|tara:strand:- start:65 stop:1012 length:948 start_codon:yes stop_codon:yes gene_type:complete
LILFGLIIWTPSLVFPTLYTGISSFAYNQILFLTAQNIYLLSFASFFITLLTAFLLNKCAIDNGLSGKISTLIALIYILLTSSLSGESHNNPVIWINFLLVFVVGNLMRLPCVNNTIPVIFNAAFLIGLASLFYSQLVFLVLLIWVSIFIHRIVTWRNLVVTLIGTILPYFLLLTLFFAMDILLEESYVLFDSLQIDTKIVFMSDPVEIAVSVIWLLIIIISAVGVANRLPEKNITLRRNLIITYFYIGTVLLILIIFTKSLVSTLLFCIPTALLIGHWLSSIRKTRWYDITLSLVLILIILNQYLYLLFSLYDG